MADISINPVTRRVQYTGNTGLGPFAFTFNILQDSDIIAYKNSTLLTLTTDYTVTINVNGTGSITLTGSGNGTALVTSDILTIIGGRELSRTTDFVTAGDLLASSLNEQLDSQVIMIQQLDEKGERTMRVSPDDVYNDMTLPLKTSRAGKTLAFDSNGDPVVGEDIGNWRGDWAAGTTYTVRDLVKDTSTASIYRCNTGHVSSGSEPLTTNTDSAKWDLVIDGTAVADAEAAQAAAEAAQAAAETAQTAAETAETNAASSASAASTSATNAASSASAASSSASSASTSATNSANSATASAASATAAAASETAAAASESAAATSESNASTSASAASTSATNAATSASTASTSASNAASSASAAATSATNAATSETNAGTAQTAAETAQAAAEAALASFNATYLGAQASDPSVDNEGDPVTAGDWYFNTSSNISRIYNGSTWSNVSVDPAIVVAKTSSTGAAVLPVGSTAQRDGSPVQGYLRFNSDDGAFEGYNGSAWAPVGGGATGGGSDAVFVENDQTVTTNYTIPASKNAMSTGPVTVNSGVTVTVSSGSRYVVI